MGHLFGKLWEYENDYNESLLQAKAAGAMLSSKKPNSVIFDTHASIGMVGDYYGKSVVGE